MSKNKEVIYDKDGKKWTYDESVDRWYDEDGYDDWGFDKYGYDKDGYDMNGYDEDGYWRDGYNEEGYDRDGNSRDDVEKAEALTRKEELISQIKSEQQEGKELDAQIEEARARTTEEK